jgi:DNA-directed RNA polymerase specialized sigma24 family protein
VGAPKTTRPGSPDRILREHGDALYDFALAVTGDSDRAVAAVREAVVGAVESYGARLDRARLLGCVFAVAARSAVPPPALDVALIESGPGSPDELQRLARRATMLLDPIQRGCLDLALRQNLEGEELSEALGVTPGLASLSVQAATDQAEHIIGAVLLARVGRDDCPGLTDISLETVGAPAEKLAAAVVEHGESCPACGDRRRALVQVTTLLANLPPVPAPAELKRPADLRRRGGIVRALRPTGATPTPARMRVERRSRRRQRSLVAAGAGVLVVAVALAVLWPDRSGEIAPTAAPGGQLAVDTTPVEFGPTAGQGGVRITNTGREPLVFETRSPVPWISFVGGEGTIDPGGSAVVSVVLDRARAPEGAADSDIRIQSNGGSAVVPVRAVVERAPEISAVEVTPQTVMVRRCPGSTPAHVRAAIVEESGLAAVELHWRRDGGVEQVSPMSAEAQSSYRGALGPFDTPGHVHWWISAVDIRNNRVQTARQELRVGGC